MTGFARVDGVIDGWRFAWELRSVNGRSLEWRSRLPSGYDALEPELRKAVKEKIARGSVSVSLNLQSDRGEGGYRINEAMLADALAMIERLRKKGEFAPSTAEGVLALRGVIEQTDEGMSADSAKTLQTALLKEFSKGVDALVAARRKEGDKLAAILAAQFDELEKLTGEAAANASASPAAIQKRIEDQLAELLSGASIAEDRLAQEAAMLAIKADVREELDRLTSHIAAGRALLKRKDPVGRELDFLTQECNREANTLCSKAADMDLKRTGLDLKRVVDQIREQVQNVE